VIFFKKLIYIFLVSIFSCTVFAADDKPGRFFEDQPDVEEYNTHTIYLLTKDGKDKEWDVNGKIEKLTFKVNKKFKNLTAKNKKSYGEGQTFKLDLTKDGKLDLTFLRLDITKKELDKMKWEGQRKIYNYIAEKGFNNPKKTYIVFTNFKDGNNNSSAHGLPNSIIYGPAMFGYGEPTTTMISLKTYIQAQGAAYACGKGTHKKKELHTKGADVLKSNDSSNEIDRKNNTYYRHNIEGCPDLANSIFVTPTSSDPWIPYEVFCEQNVGRFTHKDVLKFVDRVCNAAS